MASRMVPRLTPNSAARLASTSRVSAGSSLFRMRCRSARPPPRERDVLKHVPQAPSLAPRDPPSVTVASARSRSSRRGRPARASRPAPSRPGEDRGDPGPVPGQRAGPCTTTPTVTPAAPVAHVVPGVQVGDRDQVAEQHLRTRAVRAAGSCRSRSQPAAGRPMPLPASLLGTTTRTPARQRPVGPAGGRPAARRAARVGVHHHHAGGTPGRLPALAASSHAHLVTGPHPGQVRLAGTR